ncbi:MAG: FKBP-type peptidyl-prolyl cis-trans isomerase [Candidatus Komeilibacteria bacterium]|nr:FKBP-type peptidyl-prolyl cis-trans isomerase [Candidatus Komeilibacteria bacterium]
MKKLLFLAGILLLGLTGCTLPNFSSNQVKNLNLDEAKASALSFINENLVDPKTPATLGEVKEVSGVYQIMVNLGDQAPVTAYLTKDGKYFFSSGMEVAKVAQEKAAQAEAVKNAKVDIQTLTAGTGEKQVKTGDSITVNYKGTLEDGTVFDSSYDKKAPITITLGQGQVIPGWEQGLVGMKVGEKRKLVIPPALAYGAQGYGSVIPPNATLTFEVELVSINN